MNTKTEDQLVLAYEISDEALESAAMGNTPAKNLTLTFCSTSLQSSL